jgi:hypothetical protein
MVVKPGKNKGTFISMILLVYLRIRVLFEINLYYKKNKCCVCVPLLSAVYVLGK